VGQVRVRGLQVLLERGNRSETASAQHALGQVPYSVVLGVRLQLVQRLERQAALVAPVFINVLFGHEDVLLPGVVRFAEMDVQVLHRGEVHATALFPAQVPRPVRRLFDFNVTGVVLMLTQVVNVLAHLLTSGALVVFVHILFVDFVGFLVGPV